MDKLRQALYDNIKDPVALGEVCQLLDETIKPLIDLIEEVPNLGPKMFQTKVKRIRQMGYYTTTSLPEGNEDEKGITSSETGDIITKDN